MLRSSGTEASSGKVTASATAPLETVTLSCRCTSSPRRRNTCIGHARSERCTSFLVGACDGIQRWFRLSLPGTAAQLINICSSGSWSRLIQTIVPGPIDADYLQRPSWVSPSGRPQLGRPDGDAQLWMDVLMGTPSWHACALVLV